MRYRLPWSWSSFDYRELCELLFAQCDARFETAKVEGRAGDEAVRTDRGVLHAPLIVDACGWRRVLADPHFQPPEAPLSRGLEVHPDGGGEHLDVWIDRSLARRGFAWSVPADGEQRVGVGSYDPRDHVKEPTNELAERLGVDQVRYQGNWFPHRLRPAAEDGVFCVGDAAGHCFPLSGEGIRTAFYFGIACGRELRAVHAGERTREEALERYAAFSAAARQGLPPRAAPAAPDPGAAAARADAAAARRWATSGSSTAPSAGTSTRRHPSFAAGRDAAARLTSARAVEIAYDERGLVPCVVQDWRTGEVLTLAYANAEAVQRTRETGELHLWSRSRDELWHKGATSGNTQRVRALRLDCDGDALLALVEPAGPACHTGERTCFHNGEIERPRRTRRCPALERTLADRARGAPRGLLHRRAARRPAADRREGAGGGRGGRARRARGDRRPRRQRGRRRPVPPDRAAAQPRPHARRRRGGAR